MTAYTIENEKLSVTIAAHGAELSSIYDKENDRELIWQADPAIWDRHSPVLFPWAGRLANGELIHNGKHYSGGQHGFIRDLEHILKQNNGISAQLMFRADEETKTLRFPFDFEFTSVFTLDGHTLHHEVHVKNCGDENMRCGIGFHPGFNIPFRSVYKELHADHETGAADNKIKAEHRAQEKCEVFSLFCCPGFPKGHPLAHDFACKV